MSSFLLFAIPADRWTDGDRKTPPDADELLREQLCELRALRARIAGGVNLESERDRFSSAMSRVEGELLNRLLETPADANAIRSEWDTTSLRETIDHGHIPVMQVDEGYLHLLVAVELARAEQRTPGISEPADPLALGASVFEASQLMDHVSACERELATLTETLPGEAQEAAERRATFLEAVRELGTHGVIEMQIAITNEGEIRPAIARSPSAPVAPAPPTDDALDDLDPGEPGERRTRREEMAIRLDREVAAAVEQFRLDGKGGKVNVSNQPHEVTTDVLGSWVRAEGEPSRVRIVYADGSEAAPFPLCALRGRAKPAGEPRVIKAALMSMRHLDIDRIVDLAWYRNREVSQSRSLAESDEFCFRESLEQLKRLFAFAERIDQTVRLEMYHTGFEPAAMGFYRAVAATLTADDAFQAGWAKGSAARLIVAPFYYRGGTTYEPSRDRDGALLEWF